jgi:hypothetical protein
VQLFTSTCSEKIGIQSVAIANIYKVDCAGLRSFTKRHGIFPTLHMEKTKNEEIIQEMTQLMEKMAVDSFIPVTDAASEHAEAVFTNIKVMNARYDKYEALTQIKALMEKYNIQIDELLDQINISHLTHH